MTVYLYSGTPGSGKSVHQAYNIKLQIKKYLILTNYELNLTSTKLNKYKDNWIEIDNIDLTPDYLYRISEWWFSSHKFKEGSIKLYIDEAQILFNSRNYNDYNRMKWIKFFTQHRKYGFDVYLISQFDRMLDRQIRAVIEVEVKHRKLSQAGIKGRILSLILGGNSVYCVYYWYGMRDLIIQRDIMHIRKSIFKLFDSYKKFDNLTGDKFISEMDLKRGSARKAEPVSNS